MNRLIVELAHISKQVVVFFFQYNQSWTSLPSIVLSSNRYLVHDA